MSAQLNPASTIERKSIPANGSCSSRAPAESASMEVSFRFPRTDARYRSAVSTSLLLVFTAVAVASSCQIGHRRWREKSAPVDDVSELPLVPTNAAPICTSHNGGGGGG